MKVSARLKGIHHDFALGHARQYSQLQLTVVCHDQSMLMTSIRHKGLSDLENIFVHSRLILQIRIAATQTTRLGVDVEAGVDTLVVFSTQVSTLYYQILKIYHTDLIE